MPRFASLRIDLKADGHVHTALCRHATGSMEEYVLAALHRGLHTLCFLEHLETEINYPERLWLTDEDFAVYFEEGLRLQKRYKGRLTILLGVEAGYNPDCPETVVERLARHPWDRIGISFHFLRIGDRHHNMLSRNPATLEIFSDYGIDRILDEYFDHLRQAVLRLPGKVLCHLDAPLRHHPAVFFNERHDRKIAALLDAVMERGMAVELNASGLPIRGAAFPAPLYLADIIQRGIPLVAGSDAHRATDVGNFQALARWISSLQEEAAPEPPAATIS